MVEAIRTINTGEESARSEPTVKSSYPLRDGHFFRGCFASLQKHLRYSFPDLHMRHIPDHENVVNSWLQKRNMMRIRRDGRR